MRVFLLCLICGSLLREHLGVVGLSSSSTRHKQDKNSGDDSSVSRRSALSYLTISITTQVPFLFAAPSLATASSSSDTKTTTIQASWTATQGLNSLEESQKFVSFDASAYAAMVNDASRTPLFEKAILKRLQAGGTPTSAKVVLDLGTGPFALFAIVAAQNGASKVYAVEASPEAAQIARTTVQKMGLSDTITIVEGFSTDVSLPEKVDFCVAEIVGSVASEEGAYATIRDARRFLKDPDNPQSWIPNRIQTFAAPASYSLHNLFTPPAFDWTKLQGEPVRFNCRDQGLQLLDDPVLVEDIDFANMGQHQPVAKRDVTFTVDPERVEDNTYAFYNEFVKARLPKSEAEQMAAKTASSLTGIALWPRLVLDEDVVVNSRVFPTGNHQKSHWQTVLPIMSSTPVAVKGGSQIKVSLDFDLPTSVTKPASYSIAGTVSKL